MRAWWEPIARVAWREVSALLGSMWGWGLGAAILLLDGLLFQGFALSERARPSAEVLSDLFYILFGTTLLLSVLLTMRLFPEERSQRTLSLLMGAPLSSAQIVLGKFLGALLPLLAITAASAYLPAWVWVSGKIAPGHVGAGYLGVALVGAASCAVGTLVSAQVKTQLQAALLSSALLVASLLGWLLARVSAPPFDALFAGLSFYDANFKGFLFGQLHLSALFYYTGITALALWSATLLMKSRRGA